MPLAECFVPLTISDICRQLVTIADRPADDSLALTNFRRAVCVYQLQLFCVLPEDRQRHLSALAHILNKWAPYKSPESIDQMPPVWIELRNLIETHALANDTASH